MGFQMSLYSCYVNSFKTESVLQCWQNKYLYLGFFLSKTCFFSPRLVSQILKKSQVESWRLWIGNRIEFLADLNCVRYLHWFLSGNKCTCCWSSTETGHHKCQPILSGRLLHPLTVPLSCGSGESSTGTLWVRYWEEPWDLLCLWAFLTDFRVNPSTFSDAEMADILTHKTDGRTSTRAVVYPLSKLKGLPPLHISTNITGAKAKGPGARLILPVLTYSVLSNMLSCCITV